MVGYKPDDQMTANEKLIAGGISGALTRFVSQPLDVLKIRTQLKKHSGSSRPKTVIKNAKIIYSEEGITGFWHGHNLGQIHSVLSSSCQFYVYEQCTKFAFKIFDQKYKLVTEFLCGICSGICVCTLMTPLEVLRVRQILIKEQYKGIYNGAKAVYKSGGFLAFYEGWFTGVLMAGPQMGITFAVFGLTQPLILKYLFNDEITTTQHHTKKYPQELIVASSTAALIAGISSKTLLYPMDLARRRLQVATHKRSDEFFTPSTSKDVIKCSKLSKCIRDTYHYEGFRGLYRGLNVTLYKTKLTTVLTFTTYEMLCYCMREFVII